MLASWKTNVLPLASWKTWIGKQYCVNKCNIIQLVTSHLQWLNCMHLASPWTITLGNHHPCWWAKLQPAVAAAVASSPSAGDIGPLAMFWPCAVILLDMCYRITSILFIPQVCPYSSIRVCNMNKHTAQGLSSRLFKIIYGYLGINRVEQEQGYNCYGNPLWPFSCSSLPAPFFSASAAEQLVGAPFHHRLIGSKMLKMHVLK